ncbi:RHS repeat-associated core domain-containing protein [Mitsuaria sp. CC2]|uniref:RHS repeat-associated core domain-containing protein n=1 Tax=Mitsuaria sp. CC2 TaxID=3029186 RepID=UPI003B8D2904
MRSIDAMGHVQERAFDAEGRVVAQTDGLGRVTRMAYNVFGQLRELIDAAGRAKTYLYDANSRLIAYVDCSGSETRFDWDARGRLVARTDALGHSVRYGWDEIDRLVAIRHPDGGEERFSYDAMGRLLVHMDGVGRQTTYRYQMQGLPIERIDAAGRRLQYHYDRALRLVELINANGESYCLAYDAQGRLIQETETGFDGLVSRYDYDAAGELVANQRGAIRTDYVRDALGRMVARVTPDGQERFAWDPLSRVIAVENVAAQSRLRWDAAGQLIEERQRIELAPERVRPDPAGAWPDAAERGTAAASFLLRHEYDALGQRVATRLPNGRVVQTQRYGPGHWHGVLWQGRPLADVDRDALHRETRRSLGGLRRGGLRRELRYDRASRWTRSVFGFGDAAPGALRERIDDSVLGELRYTHDVVGQLMSAVQPGLRETFAFDPAGNLVPLPGAVPAASLPAGQHAAAAPKRGNLVTQALGWHYEYDADGNAVRKQWIQDDAANEAAIGEGAGIDALSLQYDANQRLIRAERATPQGALTSRYAYDAMGRRVLKRLATPDGERVTVFVWNGDLMVQEVDAQGSVAYVHEPDSFTPLARVRSVETLSAFDGGSVAFAPVIAWDRPDAPSAEPDAHVRWYRRLERWRADCNAEQAAQASWDGADAANDEVLFYECDHLGTPLALLDENGRARWRARYRAWGRLARTDVDEVRQPLRFQGQYEDEETGLFYNRHRYYDPDAGRYLTQDPIGLMGGINPYQYAPDPIQWTDPLGLKKGKGGCDPCCGRDPASEARNWQGTKPYTGKDAYTNVVVKKGTVFYTLYPHGNNTPNYFSKAGQVLSMKGKGARAYNDSLQLAHKHNDPDTAFDYRTRLHKFILQEDTCMAMGTALANPKLGKGGGTQFFLEPQDTHKMRSTTMIYDLK